MRRRTCASRRCAPASRGWDAILYTHAHADHCHGIDDARAFNFTSGGAVPVYGDERTLQEVAAKFSYAFHKPAPVGGAWFRPAMAPNVIAADAQVEIAGLPFQTILQHHGKGRSLGYRLGNFAYSTDVDNLPERSLQLLEKLDVWLVDCLQHTPAVSHALWL
ncbi:MAG: MBL fold metallo-hydrolase [Alphaproteobacteria bacterium]